MEMKKRNNWGPMLLVVLLGLLFSGSITAQNVLRVADFTAPADKETVVPIYLDNSAEVVGMQFDITMPYKKGSTNAKHKERKAQFKKKRNIQLRICLVVLHHCYSRLNLIANQQGSR